MKEDRALRFMSAMTRDERTAAIKNYEYAVGQGYKKSFEEFQTDSRTTHEKDYDRAVKDGYTGTFNEWMLEMRKAGATRITLGEKLEEKKAVSELQGQLYFQDPKWVDDVSKYISDKAVRSRILTSDDPNAERREVGRYIDRKIEAGGGTIQSVKWSEDGRTAVWTVQWEDGTVGTVRYAF